MGLTGYPPRPPEQNRLMPPPRPKKETDMCKLTDTLAERRGDYGDFTDHAAVSQQLQRVVREGWVGDEPTDTQQEAIQMVCHKLARITTGRVDHEDSWRDLAGYAMLVAFRVTDGSGTSIAANAPDVNAILVGMWEKGYKPDTIAYLQDVSEERVNQAIRETTSGVTDASIIDLWRRGNNAGDVAEFLKISEEQVRTVVEAKFGGDDNEG